MIKIMRIMIVLWMSTVFTTFAVRTLNEAIDAGDFSKVQKLLRDVEKQDAHLNEVHINDLLTRSSNKTKCIQSEYQALIKRDLEEDITCKEINGCVIFFDVMSVAVPAAWVLAIYLVPAELTRTIAGLGALPLLGFAVKRSFLSIKKELTGESLLNILEKKYRNALAIEKRIECLTTTPQDQSAV